MKTKAHILLIIGITLISSSLSAQIFFGANIKAANFMQSNSTISSYSSLDYNLEVKYQIKKMNISLNWGRISRLNEFSSDNVTTENDRIALMMNFLPMKENSKFGVGMGFGYFARIPYKVSSLAATKYANFYTSGITSNINVNFFTSYGYFSIGLKNDIDLQNSIDNNDLKLLDYGFFIGTSLNLKQIFSKD